jgi:alkylated DNA repair dioxygenase AlkB
VRLVTDALLFVRRCSIKFSGDLVVGVSLLSEAVLQLRDSETSDVLSVLLPPRSLYVMRCACFCLHAIVPL